MRKVILASHGSLAEGMQSAIKMILGSAQSVEAYGLDQYGEPDVIYAMIQKKVQEEPANEFIIITDINGGSVQNQMLQLCAFPNVFVQTGMCLSMALETVLSCMNDNQETMEGMMSRITASSKENMLGFSQRTIEETKEDELW